MNHLHLMTSIIFQSHSTWGSDPFRSTSHACQKAQTHHLQEALMEIYNTPLIHPKNLLVFHGVSSFYIILPMKIPILKISKCCLANPSLGRILRKKPNPCADPGWSKSTSFRGHLPLKIMTCWLTRNSFRTGRLRPGLKMSNPDLHQCGEKQAIHGYTALWHSSCLKLQTVDLSTGDQ